MVVYMISKNGKPLMPTTRCGHVRWLLKNNLARVVETNPFTVQLKYMTDEKTQSLTMGIDSGRTNIGISVVKDNGEEVFSAEVTSRNKDVTKLMTARREQRMAKRRHRRTKRQRRAVANKTTFNSMSKEIFLSHYEKPITVKYIKNKEARYCNRKRPKGWLTPTVRHCVLTHINLIKKIAKFLPITRISIEVNTFDFQLMDNPNIKAWEYSKGRLFGYDDINHYVSECQDGKCLLCGNKIEHYHHIVPRSENGSNSADNIAGLCLNCHSLVHKNEEIRKKLSEFKEGLVKKYSGSAVLNAAMSSIIDEISKLGYEIWLTTGKRTYAFRKEHNVIKTHNHDAYCIACDSIENIQSIKLMDSCYKIRQFRRHDRAIIHKANFDRNYYLDGKFVATNRNNSMCQTKVSLADFRENLSQQMDLSDVEHIVSKLVCKQHKPAYKDPKRVLSGAVIKSKDNTFVLIKTEGKHNGVSDYYVSEENKKYRYKTCQVVRYNEGLVFCRN